MSTADLLVAAAKDDASDEDVQAFIALIDRDPDEARRVLWTCEKPARSLHWNHVHEASTPIQLSLCEKLAAAGAFEHMRAYTFTCLTRNPDGLAAFVRGAEAGGQLEGLRTLARRWVEKELSPEKMDDAARAGGRFTETAGVERAAKDLAETLQSLPEQLQESTRSHVWTVLSESPSDAAGMFHTELRALL